MCALGYDGIRVQPQPQVKYAYGEGKTDRQTAAATVDAVCKISYAPCTE